MGLFSFIGKLFKWLLIGGIIVGMTLIPTSIVITAIVAVNVNTPILLHRTAAFVYLALFGVTGAELVLRRTFKAARYTVPLVIISAPIFVVANFVAGLAFIPTIGGFVLNGDMLLVLSFIAVMSLLALDIIKDHLKSKGLNLTATFEKIALGKKSTNLVGIFEVVEIPDDHVNPDVETPREKIYEPFYNILRGATSASIPVGLRLQRAKGTSRSFFLTLASTSEQLEKNVGVLQSLLRAQLPRFRVERTKSFEIPHVSENGHVAFIKGEPLSIENPRQRPAPLSEVIRRVQITDNAVIQVFATPAPKGLLSTLTRWSLKRKYEDKSTKARFTMSSQRSGFFSSAGEQSQTHVDVVSMDDAERAFREFQRYKAAHSCELWVAIAAWGASKGPLEQTVKTLSHVLKSSVLPSDPERDLRIKTSNRQDHLQRILAGQLVGPKTRLTFDEAVMLFVYPQADTGVRTAKRSAFSTAVPAVKTVKREPGSIAPEVEPRVSSTKKKKVITKSYGKWKFSLNGRIYLGTPLREDGTPLKKSVLSFDPQELERHTLVCGSTRSGKTVTSMSIVAQCIACGVIPLILALGKAEEWRILKDVENKLRIFTPGNPNISPLRINPWKPPKGVPLASWVQRLVEVFSSWLPNDDVITMLIELVIHKMYHDCGWSIEDNIEGRPILLNDLYDAAIEFGRDSLYGQDVRQNMHGALVYRIRKLMQNPLAAGIFNTPTGVRYADLLQHSTLIEMQGLRTQDASLLAGLITAGISEYRLTHTSSKIENLLVLEEAHRLLKVPKKSKREGFSAHEHAIEELVEMLRMLGGVGLGVLIIDQAPSQLASEALILPGNIIIHQLKSLEREVVGPHAGCTPKQTEHIGGMRKGEAVIGLARDSVPKNVMVLHLNLLLVKPPRVGYWTRGRVKTAMKRVFDSHPELIETGEPIIEKQTGTLIVEDEDSIILQLLDNPTFRADFKHYIEQAEHGVCGPIANWLLELSGEFSSEDDDILSVAEQIYFQAKGILETTPDESISISILSRIREGDAAGEA